MTSELQRPRVRPAGPTTARSVSGILARTVLLAGALAAVAAVVVALAGGAGLAGAFALGAGLALVVLTFGAFTLSFVAGAMPGASLMMALLTYALQLLLVLVGVVALGRSGLVDAESEQLWCGLGVIGMTLLWVALQVALTVRSRIPLYTPVPTATGGAREAGDDC
ncbi:hypothetical protein [Nocardioides pantholopis]|uniref:hypothetical protein n=1 Tax=Nocardioides pantholopis TaxID=2483798 RepID=UPI000F07AEB0|nr:hypothetical protein [Nocardioides pantholopis]